MARARPARTLVRLKLRLLRASLQLAGIQGKVAFGFAYLLAIGSGLAGGVLFALLRGASDEIAGDVTRLLFAGLLAAWTLGPVLFAASENTLEADRLAMFPLGPRDLMPGFLLASVVGFGGLATVLFLLGGLVGMTPASGFAVVPVVAFAMQLGICVATSRIVSTWLSALVRKRRWRDVVLTLVPLLGLAISFSGQLVNWAGPDQPATPGPEMWRLPDTARTVLRLLPSGPPAEAVAAARDGRALEAAGGLLGGVVVLVALTYVWWRGVVRVMTTADESTSGRTERAGARAGGRRPALFPRALWWLPAGRVGAVAAKELRLVLRDPRQRAGIVAAMFPIAVPILSLRSMGGISADVVLIAASAALFYGGVALNLYGYDGPRFWVHLAAGDDARSDLLGKNVALVVTTGFMVLVDSLVLAAISGGWARLPVAWGLSLLTLALMLGIGNVMSVSNPVALPDSRTNVWAQDTAKSAQLMGPVLLSMLATGIVVGPFAVATLMIHSVPASVALIAVEVAVAWLLWHTGFRRAVARSARSQAELLLQLDVR